MHRYFSLILLASLLVLSLNSLAKDFNAQKAHRVTAEDEALFQESLSNLKHYIYADPLESQGRIELGRTWYDYATNNEMGRMLAHAYGTGPDGIHAVFMKILPQGAVRQVVYDYYIESLGGFIGNLAITTDRATGWGRVLNGKNDEALVSMHANPVQMWKDAAEADFIFSTLLTGLNPGVFAGMARTGDTLVFISQQNNLN